MEDTEEEDIFEDARRFSESDEERRAAKKKIREKIEEDKLLKKIREKIEEHKDVEEEKRNYRKN